MVGGNIGMMRASAPHAFTASEAAKSGCRRTLSFLCRRLRRQLRARYRNALARYLQLPLPHLPRDRARRHTPWWKMLPHAVTASFGHHRAASGK